MELDEKISEICSAPDINDTELTEALTDLANAKVELQSEETAKAINLALSARTRWTLEGEVPNPAFTKFLKILKPQSSQPY